MRQKAVSAVGVADKLRVLHAIEVRFNAKARLTKIEEVAAMFPFLLVFRIHEANIRLVHKGRGLQCLTRRFLCQLRGLAIVRERSRP
jgi:hypothetical protein